MSDFFVHLEMILNKAGSVFLSHLREKFENLDAPKYPQNKKPDTNNPETHLCLFHFELARAFNCLDSELNTTKQRDNSRLTKEVCSTDCTQLGINYLPLFQTEN